MKPFLTLAFSLSVFCSLAQKNEFLDRAYWKNSPDVAKVKADIARGNDPAELNSNAFDPTVFAILEQAPNETVKFLLAQKGNDANKITHDERTYIFWAAYKGNTELMEHLLKSGARMNLRDDKGFTPLLFAAANGQPDTAVYDICLREGANISKDVDLEGANALLLIAPYDRDFKLVNYFVSKGLSLKDTDANGNTVFDYAAKSGNIEFLKALLDKGVKPTPSAMVMAAKGTRGHLNKLEVYQFLEEAGIKPAAEGKSGETALHFVVTKEKQGEIVRYLMAKGADVNKPDHDGNTPFVNAAATNSDTEMMQLLLPKVKDINQANKKDVTALHLAVKNNSEEIVKLLIAKGASVNLSDANGDGLAYYLMQSYNPQKKGTFQEKLKALQQYGYVLDGTQKNGNTLYHLAVAKNDLSLLEFAAGFNADINARNKEGLTALHKAALVSQNDALLRYLVSKGAKKDIRTDFKETAYDIASENEALTKNKVSIDFLK